MTQGVRNLNMKNVLIFFITAPAWKIFSLFILPILLFILGVATSASIHVSRLILLSGIWTVLLWMYSIGILLHDKYSPYLNIPVSRFKVCISYGFIYSIFFMSSIIPFEYLMPFHLASFCCNMYALYFVSKLVVLIERKSEVKIQNYIGTFVLVWFYLIGVWLIQPRVAKLFLSNDV